MMTPEERYRTDPLFHTLVCRIKDVLDGAQFTPDEVREAATLACTHSEAERRPQIVVDPMMPPDVLEIRSGRRVYRVVNLSEATYEPAGVPAANLLNAVYTERNRVVAGLARAVIAAGGLAGLATDPAEPDWPVVIIDLPGYGQVSWHVPEAEAEALFSFLGPYPGEWDGHTTEEKYDRLDAYAHERTSMAVWAAS